MSTDKITDQPSHIKWVSINLLHYVIATYQYLLVNDGLPLSTVSYRGKIKLHGTNAGVQRTAKGTFAQSRTEILTLPSGDRKGFASWVKDNEGFWEKVPVGTTVFGEWCGPGVERKSAIAKHTNKIFAIFALQVGYDEEARIVYDPEEILKVIPSGHPEIHVLPWYSEVLTLNYADSVWMEVRISVLNELISSVEKEDPWVKEIFGISGMGEGIVFYPLGEHASSDPERLSRTMFKAKGVKHAKVQTRVPVEIAPEVLKSIEGFVSHMVTENRLEQGLTEVCEGIPSMRHTKVFLDWVTSDVLKESKIELEAAGLTWDNLVMKAVQSKARLWLRSKTESH